MPFQKGNKLGKGGKKPGAGRPTREQEAIKKAAGEIAREYIEANITPIVETYVALAAGQVVERRTPEGEKKFELEVNPRVTVDAIGKFLSAAKQELGITALHTLDRESLQALMFTDEGRAAAELLTKALMREATALLPNGNNGHSS